MKDTVKRIFSRDLDEAFIKARADERAICEREHQAERDKEIRRIEGEYILKIKLLEQTNASLERQLRDVHTRDKILDEKEQQIKEARVTQRRLASDLVSIAERKKDFDLGVYQEFKKLEQDIIKSECEIVGVPNDKL
jgi:hypothetical protein